MAVRRVKKLIAIRVSLIKTANAILAQNPRLKNIKKGRKLSGQALVKLKTKKVDKVDRVINARSKGVKFVRIRGRIVPIKPRRRT